jgi:glucose-6-phosphate dehydrogenase assembly protein OpcA
VEKPVRVDRHHVESELARLWDAEAQAERAARVELVTLVTFVSSPALLDEVLQAIARVGQAMPSRAVTVACDLSADSPDADVALQRVPEGPAVGDSILLRAGGRPTRWLLDTVEQLLLVGVPTCLWWVGELGRLDDVLDRVGHRADVVVVDSADMCVSDLEALASVARRDPARRPVVDLTWARLSPMRDLVAQFFDDRELVPYLDELSGVTVAYAPRPGDAGVVSAEGALLVGWLAAALGLEPARASSTRDLVRRRGKPERVAVEIRREERAGVPHGTLLSVELMCADARFTVARLPDDSSLLRCSCRVPAAVVPSHLSRLTRLARVDFRDAASLLAPHLRGPARDPMFEASLEIARELFGA